MKKVYLILAFTALTAVSAFAQVKHDRYIKDSEGNLFDYYSSWTPGSPIPNAVEDENFFIGRQRPLVRFTNTESDPIASETKRNSRKLHWWCPINQANDNGWRSLPAYHFNSEVFSMWSYIDIYGNWTQPFLRNPGAFADVCHKNGVANEVVSTAPWMVTVTSTDGTHGQNYSALASGGADKLMKMFRYYGIDGLGFNSEQTWEMRANMKTLFTNCHSKRATYNVPLLHFSMYQLCNTLSTSGSGTDWSDFFPYANAFFLNYNWSASLLSSSASNASRASSLDYVSSYDVYAGIDMQAAPSTSWSDISSNAVSIGLWGAHNQNMLFERATSDGSKPLTIQNCYQRRSEQFFTGGTQNPVNSLSVGNAKCQPSASFFGINKLVAAKSTLSWNTNSYFPFITYFNLGNGQFFNNEGVTTYDNEWYNIGLQDFLPTWRWWITTAWRGRQTSQVPSDTHATFTWEDAWFGGSCMKLTFDNAVTGSNLRIFHLFKTDFPLPNTDTWKLRIRYKVLSGSAVGFFAMSATGTETTAVTASIGTMSGATWQVKEVAVPSGMVGKTMAMLGLQFRNIAAGTEILVGEMALYKEGVIYSPVCPTLAQTKILKVSAKGFDFKTTWNMTLGGNSTSTTPAVTTGDGFQVGYTAPEIEEHPLTETTFTAVSGSIQFSAMSTGTLSAQNTALGTFTPASGDKITAYNSTNRWQVGSSASNGSTYTATLIFADTLQAEHSFSMNYVKAGTKNAWRGYIAPIDENGNLMKTAAGNDRAIYNRGVLNSNTQYISTTGSSTAISGTLPIGAKGVKFYFTCVASQSNGIYLGNISMACNACDPIYTGGNTFTPGSEGNLGTEGTFSGYTANDGRNAWEPVYNDEVGAWYYEIWTQQYGKEPHLITCTTSWAAYGVEAPIDLTGTLAARVGVRTVAPDGVTKSEIQWSSYLDCSKVTILDEFSVDKPVIKPNETFTVGFDDVNHWVANSWRIINSSTGQYVTGGEFDNVARFTTSLSTKGLYDVEVKYINGEGKTVTETRRAMLQVSGEEVGAMPEIYTLGVDNNTKGITSNGGNPVAVTFDLDYTGRPSEGTTSQALYLQEAGCYVRNSELSSTFNLGSSDYTIAFWFKINNFITEDVGLLCVSSLSDPWPANNWGYIWSDLSPNGYAFTFRRGNANGGYIYELQNFNFRPGYWYHFCVTSEYVSGQRTAEVFINGASISARGRINNAGATEGYFDPTTPLSIYSYKSDNVLIFGGQMNGRSAMDGYYDEIQIWNKKVTSSEVISLMEHQTTIPTNLKFYWDFESDPVDKHFISTGQNKTAKLFASKASVLSGETSQDVLEGDEYLLTPTVGAGSPFLAGSFPVTTSASWKYTGSPSGKGAAVAGVNGADESGTTTVSYDTEGEYTATLTLENDYGKDTKTLTLYVVDGTVGLDGKVVENMKVYPNPFTDFVILSFAKEGDYTIEVLGLDGKVVKSENLHANFAQMSRIAVDGAAGTYLVRIKQNGTLIDTLKIVKK